LFNKIFLKFVRSKIPIIQRSIYGINLKQNIEDFQEVDGWEALHGNMKEIFEVGLPDTKISDVLSNNLLDVWIVCGFLRKVLYKIGCVIPTKEKSTILTKFRQEYGRGKKIRSGYFEWEDENTKLEFQDVGIQIHIYLTDKELLLNEFKFLYK